MGRAAAKAILEDSELELAGGFGGASNPAAGQDIAHLTGVASKMTGILVSNEINACLAGVKPDVYLDFTKADLAVQNVSIAFEHGLSPVIGTSGITPESFNQLSEIAIAKKLSGLVVPNFSIGAVLMMEFARQAASIFNQTEIVEMHHTGKVDAPSGTAMHTLKKMAAANDHFNPSSVQENELLAGARGGKHESGIRVHSLRLPGLISHQEVLFGSDGELLSIRHDSFNTNCFTKGIILSLKKVRSLKGFLIGLEHVLPKLQGD